MHAMRASPSRGAATVGRASEVRRGTDSPCSHRTTSESRILQANRPYDHQLGRGLQLPAATTSPRPSSSATHEAASATAQGRKSAGFPAHLPPQATAPANNLGERRSSNARPQPRGTPPPPKKGKEPPLTSSDALDRGRETPLTPPRPPWRCPRPLHPSSRPGGQPPATRIQGLRLEDLPDASVGRAIPPVSNKKCQGMAGRRPAHGREPLAMKDGHRGPVHRLSRVDEEPRQAPPLSRRQPSRAMASVSFAGALKHRLP